jgi:hypothetical protein
MALAGGSFEALQVLLAHFNVLRRSGGGYLLLEWKPCDAASIHM